MDDAAQAVMAIGFFGAIAVTVTSIASVWRKRIEARVSRTPPDAIEERLARIETAVDVIAVEVERISEAQRFTARLDAERETRRVAGSSAPAQEGRIVTPH
jgi:uncharacterized sporulation protein YeaH/YhbH (DUF444 family)